MIYIITVYNSLNPGSFLQATSLYKTLVKKGYSVSFVDVGARNLWKKTFSNTLKLLIKCHPILAYQRFIMGYSFSSEFKKYNIVKINHIENSNDSIFILGSDEIWNISRKNMNENPIFWGYGLDLKKSISYAPSINNSKIEDFSNFNYVKDSLNKMSSISVRDLYSKRILKNFTKNNIKVVCDPTLLIDKNEFNISKNKQFKNYILVYSFKGIINKSEVEEIKSFALENKLKIISFGTYFDWCNKTIMGDPNSFLSYINNAKYVVTTTYHGTIFSIIYNKQFAVYGTNNIKVDELLNNFKLNRKVGEQTLDDILLREKINYTNINKKIIQDRVDSLKYLDDSIKKIYENTI